MQVHIKIEPSNSDRGCETPTVHYGSGGNGVNGAVGTIGGAAGTLKCPHFWSGNISEDQVTGVLLYLAKIKLGLNTSSIETAIDAV